MTDLHEKMRLAIDEMYRAKYLPRATDDEVDQAVSHFLDWAIGVYLGGYVNP